MGSKQQKKYSQVRYKKKKNHFSFHSMMGLKVFSGVMITVFLSLVYVFFYSLITQCDYLKAEKIVVSGASQLSRDDVLKQAKVYHGINILNANLGVIRKQLLAHPDIIAADVGRVFPKTLYINIKEHHPLAVVKFGNKYVMNTHGEIYKKCSEMDEANLPLVTGLTFSDFGNIEDKKNNPHNAVMQLLKMENHGLHKPDRGRINKIHADKKIGIILYSEEPECIVKLGYGDYQEKINKLNAVLKYMEGKYHLKAFRTVDLMKNDCVVLSPMMLKESDSKQEEV